MSQQIRHLPGLPCAYLERGEAAFVQIVDEPHAEAPYGIEAVVAAVERRSGLEVRSGRNCKVSGSYNAMSSSRVSYR